MAFQIYYSLIIIRFNRLNINIAAVLIWNFYITSIHWKDANNTLTYLDHQFLVIFKFPFKKWNKGHSKMIHSALGIYERYFKCLKAEDILIFFFSVN